MTVLVYFRVQWGLHAEEVFQAVLIAHESATNREKKSDNKLWKRVVPSETEFAWLPPEIVWAFCSDTLWPWGIPPGQLTSSKEATGTFANNDYPCAIKLAVESVCSKAVPQQLDLGMTTSRGVVLVTSLPSTAHDRTPASNHEPTRILLLSAKELKIWVSSLQHLPSNLGTQKPLKEIHDLSRFGSQGSKSRDWCRRRGLKICWIGFRGVGGRC